MQAAPTGRWSGGSMPGYRVWIFQNQRQVQVANTFAMQIASCVNVNIRTDRRQRKVFVYGSPIASDAKARAGAYVPFQFI